MTRTRSILRAIPSVVAMSFAASTTQAATLTLWDVSNVAVAATPSDGITGASIVYDANPNDPSAVTNGRITFTPPEAVSPGIKVQPEVYTQGGPAGLTLNGCIMTSNPGATCTSEFQSGKRVKQQMTGFGPMDLVFGVDASSTETSTYQMFGRLINATSKSLAGFAIELGFGVGNDFVQATAADGLSFSTLFKAQPSGSGSSSTQYPFGLFGDAASNNNFQLDGFFAPSRTGLVPVQGSTSLVGDAFYGPYGTLFDAWLNQVAVPKGMFWDFDNNPATDALLMAWETAPGVWEMRRELGETCDVNNPLICAPGKTLATYLPQLNFDELVALLGGDASVLSTAGIEDLANLNLNYAISLGDMKGATSFTLRTVVFPAQVPLPMTALLLMGGLGMLPLVARRRRELA